MKKYVILLPGTMRGKQRHRTTKTGHVFTPYQTMLAENWIRVCVLEQLGYGLVPQRTAVRVLLEIDVAITLSWSKRKQADALAGRLRPAVKPDWDNTGKLLGDSLNGILWVDDSQIVDGRVVKWYGLESRAVLTVEFLE